MCSHNYSVMLCVRNLLSISHRQWLITVYICAAVPIRQYMKRTKIQTENFDLINCFISWLVDRVKKEDCPSLKPGKQIISIEVEAVFYVSYVIFCYLYVIQHACSSLLFVGPCIRHHKLYSRLTNFIDEQHLYYRPFCWTMYQESQVVLEVN